MKITLIQALLIGIVYYLGNIGTPWLSLLGSISVVYKPLVAGTLVGFILGDPVQGCIIGNQPAVCSIYLRRRNRSSGPGPCRYSWNRMGNGSRSKPGSSSNNRSSAWTARNDGLGSTYDLGRNLCTYG